MPATIVCFHAHPDDETIVTGGTMARASDDGHRVVAVFATRGELGEVGEGVLEPSETLAQRRMVETQRSADVLGVARVEYLDYLDSGMEGETTNTADGAFAAADLDEAAERLAAILRAEDADVLTIYDERGNYGHPDHVKVHDVGMRAAELVGTDRVYMATVSRQHFMRVAEENPDTMPDDTPDAEEMDLGVDEARITTFVDVGEWLGRKRAAMAAHASQITPESFFLAMPDDIFAKSFGTEWFIRVGHDPRERETWIL